MPESDSYLFHYTTREAAFGDILPKRRLRFSPYEQMRDPLENKRWFFLAGGRSDGEDPQANVRAFFTFHEQADEIRRSAKLLSLTLDAPYNNRDEQRFAQGWARARMWEQYAERHAGVCLVFRALELTDAIVRSLNDQRLASPYHRPVEYDASRLATSGLMLDIDRLREASSSAELVRRWVKDNHDTLFFAKAPDWGTEYEYRYVVTTPDHEFVYIDFGDALETVIVGERFPDWQAPAAVEACDRTGAELRRLRWDFGYPTPHTFAKRRRI